MCDKLVYICQGNGTDLVHGLCLSRYRDTYFIVDFTGQGDALKV